MTAPRVIGFAGRKGSGKSTAARALKDHAELSVHLLNFADPLKRMLRVFLTAEQTDGDHKEQPIDWLDGVTPRRLMQTLGTEWGRDTVHTDFWIKLWEREAVDLLGWAGTVVVVADVRFPNELAAIRRLGGKVIWIDRSAAISDRHVSERLLDYTDCDGLLCNESTVETLAREIVHMSQAWGALG